MEDSISVPLLASDKYGGPYDHKAYIAGCQVGLISARLSAAKSLGLTVDHMFVLRDNLKQIDLVAMSYGAVLCMHEIDPERYPDEYQDWVFVGFQWGERP